MQVILYFDSSNTSQGVASSCTSEINILSPNEGKDEDKGEGEGESGVAEGNCTTAAPASDFDGDRELISGNAGDKILPPPSYSFFLSLLSFAAPATVASASASALE